MRLKLSLLTVCLAIVAASFVPSFAQEPSGAITLTPIAMIDSGAGEGGAEIVAYHPEEQRLFVVNGADTTVDIIDMSDPATAAILSHVDLKAYGDTPNSVTYCAGYIFVVVNGFEEATPGQLLVLDWDGQVQTKFQIGAVPDMVACSPDNTKAVIAIEAEPNSDYSVDPEGAILVVDIGDSPAATLTTGNVTTLGFEGLEMPEGVRIFGPNASPAQDLEPEYVAISADSRTAFVTMQENNAVAVVDLTTPAITAILPLGYKDHSLPGNGLDASDRDGAINIANYPVLGMYLPDAIAYFEVGGAGYLITANEGDAREWAIFDENEDLVAGYVEETRIEDVTLDETAFPNAAELQAETVLGRLKITTAQGDTDGDGDYDLLYSFGARSFTVWNLAGEVVYDSGDSLEQFFAVTSPEAFNFQDNDPEEFDARSDDKGPEPEGVTVGEVNGVTYAFVGLERMGGVMVYDLSDPAAPVLVTYANTPADISPEGLIFISAENSPNGKALLVVANEVSGTTTIYEIN
jgi:DNA-binding beta-propeller fold protein YncE